jgi:hypothetical protein
VLLESGSVEVVDRDGKKRKVNQEDSAGEEVKTFLLGNGESLQTPKGTSCDLVIPGTGTMRLQPESGVKLPATPDPEPNKQRSLELLKGKLFLDVNADTLKANKQQFRLKTPATIMAVKGTRFFAATKQEGEARDTAGLHQGSVVVMESASGKFVTLKEGSAVEATAGAMGKPRRLTPEEQAESALYQEFALDFTLAERGRRKSSQRYDFRDDPNGPFTEHKGFLSQDTVEDAGVQGKVVRVRALPFTEIANDAIWARTSFELRPPRAIPLGLSFALRADGIKRVYVHGIVKEHKKVRYGSTRTFTVQIPEGTPPDEWITFYVPIMAVDTVNDPGGAEGQITFAFDMNQRNVKGKFPQIELGKKEYILEIAPISVATRPRN